MGVADLLEVPEVLWVVRWIDSQHGMHRISISPWKSFTIAFIQALEPCAPSVDDTTGDQIDLERADHAATPRSTPHSGETSGRNDFKHSLPATSTQEDNQRDRPSR
eukprot:CAMPEP_0175985458 /NCGR_PEP_ID=MMETSP0108-20121206/49575_1 /TAXON_ID=195067 ORGANISM="Goniomonas pacifica, Strain CCMP1869" /NCGR_SAMPLE_ID=MMETSP0108 /ASSEMBLY_ACC=CAM_ASM_000204 /LENGTH=105 /DNA_ID=CAMNT_0017316447 /DNA_START=17 /DNA_END=330 /DNA_ORIENTATION=+